MLHSSTKKLIDRLAEMTELGKLDWTEGDDGNIIYSTEGYSVHLPASADEVLITSIEGKELERIAKAAAAALVFLEECSAEKIRRKMPRSSLLLPATEAKKKVSSSSIGREKAKL